MAWRQTTSKPAAPKPKFDTKDDDWETDTAYENSVTEKTQRYGSTSIPGSGRVDHFDLNSIHDKVKSADDTVTSTYRDKNPNRGYGGKFGTEQVMDKAAADFSYKADIKKHSSQTDGKKGFGGEHGVDERAKDQSAVGFDYKPTVEKHASQTDASKGFGGKYGVEQNAQDKAAVGFSHKETVPKHSSQTDYTTGFGGKQGVAKEERPAPAPVAKPPAATPAVEKPAAAAPSAKADVGNIRARFENMKKEQEADAAKRVAEMRKKRATVDEQQTTQTVPVASSNAGKINNQPTPQEQKAETSPSELTAPPPPEKPADQTESNSDAPAADDAQTREEPPTEIPTPVVEDEKKDEAERFVGGVNVSAILRQRKVSSSSSKNEDDEDEWAAEAN